jgi:CHAT domain-containing protein
VRYSVGMFSIAIAVSLLAAGVAQEIRRNPLRPAVELPAPVTVASRPAVESDPAKQRDALCQRAMELAAQERWRDAIEVANQALIFQRTHFGDEKPEALAIEESIAVWQERSADFAAAASAWQTLYEQSAKVHGARHWYTSTIRQLHDAALKAAELSPQDQQNLAAASLLSAQADQLLNAGKYAESLGPARKSLETRHRLLGDESVVTAASSYLVGTALLALGDPQNAKPLLEQCAATREKLCGLTNPVTLTTLTSLSALYVKTGEVEPARQSLRKLLTGSSKLYGPVHPITLTALHQLGSFELDQDNLADAQQLLELAKLERTTIYHGRHIEIAQSCRSLGTLYLKQRELAKAEASFAAAVEMYQQLLGNNHPDVARALVELAVAEKVDRKPTDAIAHLQTAIEIFTTAVGKDSPDTIDAMHLLATVLPEVGDSAQAERLYRQVLAAYQASPEKDGLRVGHVSFDLGALYMAWNDFGSAETHLRRALETYEQVFGKENSNTAGVLSLLATVDARSGRFERAEQEARSAIDITARTLGAEHSQTVATQLTLGNIYLLANKLDDARSLFESILAKQPNATDDDRYHSAIIREKLAGIALQQSRYAEALSQAEAVLQVYEQLLPQSHPHRIESLKVAAIANLCLHREDLAQQYVESLLPIARDQLDAAALAQSERQQLSLNFHLRETLDLQLSLPAECVSAEQAYQSVLEWKGAVQSRQIRQRQQLSSQDVPLANELQNTITEFTTLSLRVPDGGDRKAWVQRLDSLKARKETLEADLAARSQTFQSEQRSATTTVSELQTALPADAVLVDILKYAHFFGGHDAANRDETRYVAFVVRRNRPILRINLGSALEIEAAITACREKALFTADAHSRPELKQLADLIWKPLAADVAGCRTILYSPDAELARFPLAALPGEKPGTYLLEDFAIGMIPVPRLLPELMASKQAAANATPTATDLLLVGNVDYNASAGETDARDLNQLAKENLGGELLTFDALKSAPDEMRLVQAQFNERFPIGRLQVLDRAGATEAAFRTSAPNARCLFLATHGFFAPPNVMATLAVQDVTAGLDASHAANHSGTLCGLALAGANQSHTTGDDGILTAYEISAIDLRNLDLAILAGCETGLGESTFGEGTMSLQRAFQIAGARTTVASLWSVPDARTKQLMQEFLHNLWANKMSKLDALREAQLSLLRSGSNPARTTANTKLPPYYWAAFVLSGDWQ